VANDFDRYCDRVLPELLRPGAVAPPGIDPETLKTARSFAKAKVAYDFALALAKGHRAHELASGTLDRGAEVNIRTGEVIRHTASLDPKLRDAASRALATLNQTGAHIDGVLQSNLEAAAYGRWPVAAGEKPIRAALEAAERAINDKLRAEQQQDREQREQPVITVLRTFTSIGGRAWPVGQHRVSEDEIGELREWLARREAEAKQRGWEHPDGPNQDGVWPPFRIETPQPVGAHSP